MSLRNGFAPYHETFRSRPNRPAASTVAFHMLAPSGIERSAQRMRPVPKSTMMLTAKGPLPEATDDPNAVWQQSPPGWPSQSTALVLLFQVSFIHIQFA